MSQEYKPILIGVEHFAHNMDLAKQLIQELAIRGITEVAMEESVWHTRQEYLEALTQVMREKETTTAAHNALLEIKKAIPKDFDPHSFFGNLARYARSMGMQVLPLASKRVIALDRKLAWRAVRDKIDAGARFSYKDPARLGMEIMLATQGAAMQYPYSYLSMHLRTREMKAITMRKKPPVVIGGTAHILDLAKTLHIRPREVTHIYQRRIIRPTTAREPGRYGALPHFIRLAKRLERATREQRQAHKSRRHAH